ncbi:MAG TPA: hypothetical protein VHB51_00770 [Candidatus Saccharimonadales bacterium]|nr:hypothetical protein [Candidatus Saccharimonadales bacterium]
MSNEEADALMEQFDKWDDHSRKRDFINRMEHKLYRKERRIRRR